jgi:hypothetical protein
MHCSDAELRDVGEQVDQCDLEYFISAEVFVKIKAWQIVRDSADHSQYVLCRSNMRVGDLLTMR